MLLLWVCWKMWRELRTGHEAEQIAAEEALSDRDLDGDGAVAARLPAKTFGQAAVQIIVADVSMSLDNVLAVAGAAHDHPAILAAGLILSIALMGLASTVIARIIARHRWLAYLGVALILYVALAMLQEGYEQVTHPEPETAVALADPA